MPTIVEAAESSPAAAKECAVQIRKFLSRDLDKPHFQYNAIMLTRILSDNPGQSFTKNIDAKFVSVVKDLLRMHTDPSVRQILIETLNTFERDKKDDINLVLLTQMWRKEQEKMAKVYGPQVSILFSASRHPRRSTGPTAPLTHQQGTAYPRGQQQQQQQQSNYFSRSHHQSSRLPNPAELSSRVEEARTTAKLLTQLVQSTPPQEFLSNELIREFSTRCQSASRSIQGYMAAENPSPDNDTMLTLIETNEQLALAQTKHQRAVLNARKAMGLGAGDGVSPNDNGAVGNGGPPRADSGFSAPPGPPPSHSKPALSASRTPPLPDNKPSPMEDPFQDPVSTAQAQNGHSNHESVPKPSQAPTTSTQQTPRQSQDGYLGPDGTRLGTEPYHPGFRETQSYVGRQDSSVGKVTMHAAGPVEEADESDEEEKEARKRKPVFRY